jgi:hypothetical protein
MLILNKIVNLIQLNLAGDDNFDNITCLIRLVKDFCYENPRSYSYYYGRKWKVGK